MCVELEDRRPGMTAGAVNFNQIAEGFGKCPGGQRYVEVRATRRTLMCFWFVPPSGWEHAWRVSLDLQILDLRCL